MSTTDFISSFPSYFESQPLDEISDFQKVKASVENPDFLDQMGEIPDLNNIWNNAVGQQSLPEETSCLETEMQAPSQLGKHKSTELYESSSKKRKVSLTTIKPDK